LGSWEGKAETEDVPAVERGYDLRAAVANFTDLDKEGLIDTSAKKIEKIIKRSNGKKIVHLTESYREPWIRRSADNAWLTATLHLTLREKLEGTEWRSNVLNGEGMTMWHLSQLIHKPLVSLLAQIEETGIVINVEFLNEIREKVDTLIKMHAKEFHAFACKITSTPPPFTQPTVHRRSRHGGPPES
jgi:DNA polymerase I-like protein with 3'-5' exonuclease and polymerase domains